MASAPKPPPPVDPNKVIQAQQQANRIDRITPFGSQKYDGNALVTSLPEGTQNAFNNISEMASNKQHLITPQFGDLQGAILNKVSQRYQPQPQKPSAQSMPYPNTINGQQTNPAWGDALNKIWSQH